MEENKNDELQVMPLRALREKLGDVINGASYGGERTLVSRNGKVVAAIISIEDLQLLEELEERADIAAFDEAMAEDDGVRYSQAEVEAILAMDAEGQDSALETKRQQAV